VTDSSLVWNTDLIEAMELENLLINAAITMHGAEQRKVGVLSVFGGGGEGGGGLA
jgi:succinate dehydrogenase/fumarate reductase flavoprotein subunit